MKTLTYFLIPFIIAFSFVSCQQQDNSKEVSQLDSLQTVLDGIEKKLFSIDTTTMVTYSKKAIANLLYIQRNNTDTLDLPTGIMLDDYNSTKKGLVKLYKNFEQMVTELLYSKGQIIDMKNDLKNGFITKEEFQNNYQVELTAIHKLNESIVNLSDKAEKAILQFEDKNLNVQELIKKINSSHNQ